MPPTTLVTLIAIAIIALVIIYELQISKARKAMNTLRIQRDIATAGMHHFAKQYHDITCTDCNPDLKKT